MDSKTAKLIKSKDTAIEIKLRNRLWQKGLRYRKNDKSVFGKPDIVFKSKRIAIFCDSEFWHGYNYLVKGEQFKSNQDFWIKKIIANVERDKLVNSTLTNNGWTVLRFWSKDIIKNIDYCVERISEAYGNKI